EEGGRGSDRRARGDENKFNGHERSRNRGANICLRLHDFENGVSKSPWIFLGRVVTDARQDVPLIGSSKKSGLALRSLWRQHAVGIALYSNRRHGDFWFLREPVLDPLHFPITGDIALAVAIGIHLY